MELKLDSAKLLPRLPGLEVEIGQVAEVTRGIQSRLLCGKECRPEIFHDLELPPVFLKKSVGWGQSHRFHFHEKCLASC